jgi:hypothetical protein
MRDEWVGAMTEAMTETVAGLDQAEHEVLNFDVSDTALEIAAAAPPGAAYSFPNAPTVSILVVCCSNDSNAAGRRDD